MVVGCVWSSVLPETLFDALFHCFSVSYLVIKHTYVHGYMDVIAKIHCWIRI